MPEGRFGNHGSFQKKAKRRNKRKARLSQFRGLIQSPQMAKAGTSAAERTGVMLTEHAPKKRSEYCWSKHDKDTLIRMVEKGFGWREIAARIRRNPSRL
jgi:hypothetical protein